MKRNNIIFLFLITVIFIMNIEAFAFQRGFVCTEGTNFMLNGETYYFAGANAYDIFTRGDGWIGWNDYSREEIESNFMDKKQIDQIMRNAVLDGIRVIRTWGFSHEEWHGFEPAKGVYSEAQFILFDYILKSANEHGVKIIIVLENYWADYGGIDSRLKREGFSAGDHDRRRIFFTDEGCKEQYKNYIEHFVTRVNSFTGILYSEDTAIFSWELMNEPRYQSSSFYDEENSSGKVLRRWIDEMALFIRELDPNHMISAGIEGHERRYGFGGDEGNPFIYIHQSPYIDFCTAHPYPDEPWANLSPDESVELIKKWIDDAHNEVGKPLVIEEFNVYSRQEEYWSKIFTVIEDMDVGGSNFWNYETRSPSNFSVYHGDPILENIFKPHAQKMIEKSGSTFIIKGDLNNDKRVNTIDYTLLKRYILGLNVNISLKAADLNDDKKINTSDYIQLRRYLLINDSGK